MYKIKSKLFVDFIVFIIKKIILLFLFIFILFYFSFNFSTPLFFSVHCQGNISNFNLIKMNIDLLGILLYLDLLFFFCFFRFRLFYI